MKTFFRNLGRAIHPNNQSNEEEYGDFMLSGDGPSSAGRQTLLVNDYLSSANGGGDEFNDHDSNSNINGNNNNNLRDDATGRERNSRKKFIISAKVMKILGNIFAVVTLLSFLIFVPWITAHAMIYDKARPDFAAFYSSGAFVLITVAMSTKLIYNHLTNWYMPDVQKYVVRILWMVPIYSVQSWLSLRFHTASIYFDTVRDFYEAYVIQSFLYYLMELLGGEDTLRLILEDKDRHYGDHPPVPPWIFASWEMGEEFMLKCKHGVIQYVIAKTLATLATAILEPIGLFNEGEFDWTKGYIYISTIINFSQMWALYCLVKFYHATSENLRHPVNWHPMGKFLCIKGVVFFTWWQGALIAALKNKGLIKNIGKWDKDDVANGLQDYLICIEMFCFAIAHAFTFTHTEYLPNREGGDHNTSSNSNNSSRDPYGRDSDEDGISPPIIRTLDTPMGFRDALWSSTVPNETFDDIKRTITNGMISDQSSNQSSEIGTLRNVSMMHAESI